MLDPGPGDGNGPLPISQTDHEELMSKANLGSIHEQVDLFQASRLGLQPLLGNRPIPFPDADCRVVQKAAKSSGGAYQLCRSRDLPGDLAQMDRVTFMNTDHQPDKVPNLSDSLLRPQFTNPAHPCIIEAVGRHEVPPFLDKFC